MTAGSIVKKLLWFLVVGSIAVALLKGLPSDTSSWLPWLQQQEASVKKDVTKLGKNVEENVKKAGSKVKSDHSKKKDNESAPAEEETSSSEAPTGN